MTDLIAKHGGYKKLKSFQMSVIIYDLTVEFCKRFIDKTDTTYRSYTTNKTYQNENPEKNSYYRHNRQADQMIQAARSGSQNIAEGSDNSGTSKQTELRLVNVAKGSLKELLSDFEAFLRQNNLSQWSKEDSRTLEIRELAYTDRTNRTNRTDRTNKTYLSYLLNPESAANCLLCLINQTCYLLDRQMGALEKDFKSNGDFRERFREIKKEKIMGNDEDEYQKILKEAGKRQLPDGRVVDL